MTTVLPRIAAAPILLIASAAGASPAALTEEQWRQDIDQVLTSIQAHHPMPAPDMRKLELPERANSLKAEVGKLNDHEIMFRIAELVASLDDGHSRLTLPRIHEDIGLKTGHTPTPPPKAVNLRLGRFPVELASFSDGLFVVGAAETQEQLLGARLESINDQPVTDILEVIRPAIHHDNENWFRRIAADRLTLPQLLQHYAVTDGPEAEFRFLMPGGKMREVRLSPMGSEFGKWVEHAAMDDQDLLRRLHPEQPYWYRVLEGRDAIYLQFRETAHEPDDPPTRFVSRLLAEAEKKDISRLVVDLRDNHGGRGMWNQPYLKGLLGHPRFDRPGGLYVLIGQATFSAAVLFLNELEQHSQAIFVGQPTGASPDHFGDARLVTLEHSGLTVRISTIFWKNWLAGEFRDAINPHLPVPERFGDLAEARDPALETALDHDFPDDPLSFFRQLLVEAGVNAAALYLGNIALDPAFDDDFSRGLTEMGRDFLHADDNRNARYVLLLANNYYPDEPEILADLGRVMAKMDQPGEARRYYRRALELEPDMDAALNGMARLADESG